MHQKQSPLAGHQSCDATKHILLVSTYDEPTTNPLNKEITVTIRHIRHNLGEI